MCADITSWDPALKQIYRNENVDFVTLKKRPMLGMFKKFEDFGGRNMPIVLLYGNPQGRSHTFGDAQANVTNAKLEDFLLTRTENHSLAHVDSQTAAASDGDKKAFLKALKKEVDAAMNSLADSIESEIPRAGTGSIGQISSGSTVTNQTITLADIREVHNFEVGMTLRASATDGAALRTGEEVLAKVNRSTGVLTATSAQWDTVITAIAAGDFLQVDGDGAGGSTNKGLSGLINWIPATAPSGGESYFGVDRSVDSRLYGTYYNGSTQLVEEALIDGQSMVGEMEGSPDCALLHNAQYRKLIKELGAKKEYCEMKAYGGEGMMANVGYKGVVVHGDYGPIEVIAANKCQSNRAWLLQRDTWVFASLGKAVRFDNTDGQTILRRASASGVEARLVSWANVGCKAPAYNGHTLLSAA